MISKLQTIIARLTISKVVTTLCMLLLALPMLKADIIELTASTTDNYLASGTSTVVVELTLHGDDRQWSRLGHTRHDHGQ